MSLPDDWTCEGQDELPLEDEPNPDDARDLRIDDDLLDGLEHPRARRIDDVDVQGGVL